MSETSHMGDFPGCQLYLVTPPAIDLESFADAFSRALDGGPVAALQLRLKDADDDTVRRAAARLLPLCRGHEVTFLLNDRPDLAMETGADGVHVGQDDMPASQARTLIGADAVIGVTCHDSRDLAIQAAEDGADYVAFGAFFPTATKSPKTRAEPWLVAWWHDVATVPQVTIGGITADNCAPLVSAGADFLAVSGGVWSHDQGPATAVRSFHQVIAQTPVDPSVACDGAS
jgi:thiamine-phosphate pyrophosphorylase